CWRGSVLIRLVQARAGMLGAVQRHAAEGTARAPGSADRGDLLRQRTELPPRRLAAERGRPIRVGLLLVGQEHEQVVALLVAHRQSPHLELDLRSVTRLRGRQRRWRLRHGRRQRWVQGQPTEELFDGHAEDLQLLLLEPQPGAARPAAGREPEGASSRCAERHRVEAQYRSQVDLLASHVPSPSPAYEDSTALRRANDGCPLYCCESGAPVGGRRDGGTRTRRAWHARPLTGGGRRASTALPPRRRRVGLAARSRATGGALSGLRADPSRL